MHLHFSNVITSKKIGWLIEIFIPLWIHPLAHCIVKPIQLLIKTNRPTQWSCIIYLHQQHSFPKIFYSISSSLCCKLLITVTINWNLNFPSEIISSNEPEENQGTICTSCSTSTNRLASTKQRSRAFGFPLTSIHLTYLASNPPLNIRLLK